MKIQILVLSLCALTFSACQNNTGTTTNANKSAVNTASTNAVTPSPTAASSEVKYYEGKGVVTEINVEKGWLEINHEEIKGLMPAMTMQFNYPDKAALKSLQVGDKVTFTLEDNKGAETLTKISKLK